MGTTGSSPVKWGNSRMIAVIEQGNVCQVFDQKGFLVVLLLLS